MVGAPVVNAQPVRPACGAPHVPAPAVPLPLRTSAIGLSRTTNEPSRRRTTAEKACGERIMTPSSSACPPIYGLAIPSGPITAG